MYHLGAFLPLLLVPFPSAAPYFVILFLISMYISHEPCVRCVFSLVLLFSSTCYWGSDRCWISLNDYHIFSPVAQSSTFGLALPAFMAPLESGLTAVLTFLGGGSPLAQVITSSSAAAASAASSAVASAAEAVVSAVPA
ncbi:hypothetical protein BG006_002553 [Podila minutissima]|uniref:Uncharacterized protein n=1 Tax=Podila minutissima TaxID=64525 RepID=A0A9P5VNC3_9FUNG|nr:hypothetical protein BG006_002553 [Podila minutissima]